MTCPARNLFASEADISRSFLMNQGEKKESDLDGGQRR